MSQKQRRNNGKLQNVADLENAASKMENNLRNMNKTIIKEIFKALNWIMMAVHHNEAGIFKVILKWFRLCLKAHRSISPDNHKLLNYFENSVPTIITYMIGCLQYKAKEVQNYHFILLEILEELLENVQPNVLKGIEKSEIGTIGCLWNSIDLSGDFNTQLKALKILSVLLKECNEIRQNKELKCIKWTNLHLFQDKLKTIVQETKLNHVLENTSRELLNNYNMTLSKNIMVYSFYCKSVILNKKHKFYKPLNFQKHWIDINYTPKTLSYKGRFKLNPNSKYENIYVCLKIQKMKLNDNMLLIYFKPPGEFSKYTDYLSNLTNNQILFTLAREEAQRLNDNSYIMEYFNSLENTNHTKDFNGCREDDNTIDLLKNGMLSYLKNETKESNHYDKSDSGLNNSAPRHDINIEKNTTSLKKLQSDDITEILVESPKTSRNLDDKIDKHPIRKLRNRKKFFTSLLIDDTDEEMANKKKTQKKRSQNKKPRITKSRCKQVCKVTPTVDLTKVENFESTNRNIANIKLEDEISKNNLPLITTQECDEVLKQVADIYNVCDTTYAKPCQSYRNFKMQKNCSSLIAIPNDDSKLKGRKKKVTSNENESSAKKIRKVVNCYSQENKENIHPQTNSIDLKVSTLPKAKESILAPYFFKSQRTNKTPNRKKLQTSVEKFDATSNKNLEIDLTLDIAEKQTVNGGKQSQELNRINVYSNEYIEFEEVRGSDDSNLNNILHIVTPTKSVLNYSSEVVTPEATNYMNISDLNDSDMEITQIFNNNNFLIESKNENIQENTKTLQTDISNMRKTKHFNETKQQIENKSKHPTKFLPEETIDNLEVSNCLQEIFNDFQYSSDETDSKCITPKKSKGFSKTFKRLSTNRNYKRDCVVFQKRIDVEDSDLSDDDIGHEENSKIPHNQNFIIMQNMPLYLSHNFSNQNNVWTSPDKIGMISTNLTTSATKCELTPTAIIMHQIQVSEKKSVILRNKNPKRTLKVNKCLNNYYENKNTVLPKTTVAVQTHNCNISNEDDFLRQKNPTNNTKDIPLEYNKRTSLKTQSKRKNNLSYIYEPENISIALHHLHNHNNEINFETLKYAFDNFNPYETPSTNPPHNEENIKLLSSSDSILSEESVNRLLGSSDNTSPNFHNRSLQNSENLLKEDIYKILNDFKTNIEIQLDKSHHQSLKYMSEQYKHKFAEITQTVLKKYEEQGNELKRIRTNIGRLVRELEWQYDDFINKSTQFNIHKELTDTLLDTMINTDIQNSVNKDYEALIKQLNVEQNEVAKKVWQRYEENHKKHIYY